MPRNGKIRQLRLDIVLDEAEFNCFRNEQRHDRVAIMTSYFIHAKLKIPEVLSFAGFRETASSDLINVLSDNLLHALNDPYSQPRMEEQLCMIYLNLKHHNSFLKKNYQSLKRVTESFRMNGMLKYGKCLNENPKKLCCCHQDFGLLEFLKTAHINTWFFLENATLLDRWKCYDSSGAKVYHGKAPSYEEPLLRVISGQVEGEILEQDINDGSIEISIAKGKKEEGKQEEEEDEEDDEVLEESSENESTSPKYDLSTFEGENAAMGSLFASIQQELDVAKARQEHQTGVQQTGGPSTSTTQEYFPPPSYKNAFGFFPRRHM